VRGALRVGERHTVAARPWKREADSVEDSPMMIKVKKIPMENTCAEFWNVSSSPTHPAVGGRQAVHDPGTVRRGECTHGQAVHEQEPANAQ